MSHKVFLPAHVGFFVNRKLFVLLSVFTSVSTLSAAEIAAPDSPILEETQVLANYIANESTANTYDSIVTALRYAPQVELQSRGIAEGQSDITVRGSVFENTAIAVGAVTITDPQTGHYAAELPIDPRSLTRPVIAVDADNAMAGFNATVATVRYGFTPITDGGAFKVGMGDHGLGHQGVHFGLTSEEGADIRAVSISAAHSESDGTVANGDHQFDRANIQLQYRREYAQTDLVLAYQDKFFGWPGAYTGFASLPETDHAKTTLLVLNHNQQLTAGEVAVGMYFRTLNDDYDFDRRTVERGAPGSFDHKTENYGFGVTGVQLLDTLSIRYGLQLAQDSLERSTDLLFGDFNRRTHGSARIMPEFTLTKGQWVYKAGVGVSFDFSDRDKDRWLPIAELGAEHLDTGIAVAISHTGSSQLPGFTALKSPPSGLFGGNAELGREISHQTTASVSKRWAGGEVKAAVFYREDRDLVDWTFASSAPFSRQANAVDLDVTGGEIIAQQSWERLSVTVGATWLDKNADYFGTVVDASFYALNYAESRYTTAVRWDVLDTVTVSVDTEYREQAANAIRRSGETALLSSVGVAWLMSDAIAFGLTVDNAFDEDFEIFPGTPAVGRQTTATVQYSF